MSPRRAYVTLLLLTAAWLAWPVSAAAQAGGIVHVYDDLGRLTRSIDATTGQCAIYEYDAVGNLLSITRQANCTGTAVFAGVAPASTPNCFIVAGQNLSGATVTVDTPGVSVTSVSATDTSVSFCLSTPAAVCSLSTNVTIRTPGGTSPPLPVTFSGASQLVAGGEAQGSITAAARTASYCFSVATTERVILQVASSTMDACVRVMPAGSTTPVSGGSACAFPAARVDVVLTAGSYFVEVADNQNNQTGAFTLAYEPIVAATATPLAADALVNAGISPVGDLDLFSFTLATSTRVILQATGAPAVVDPCIRVLTGAGGPTISGTTISCAIAARLELDLVAGTYFVEISDSGTTQSGPYTLVYQPLLAANAVPLTADVPVTTPLEAIGDLDLFRVTLAAPTRVTFQATGAPGVVDPCLRVLTGFGGAPVSGGVACGVAARVDLDLAAGTFFVEISDSGSNQAGPYTLLYEPLVTTSALPLVADVPRTALLDPVGDLDLYTFTLATPTRVVLQALGAPAVVDPCLRVTNSQGTIVPGGLTCSIAARVDLTLAAGTYFVEISDNGSNQAGPYTVLYEPLVEANAVPLVADTPVTTPLEPAGDIDVFTFTLGSPTRVVLQATGAPGVVDPCLRVSTSGAAGVSVPGAVACSIVARLDLQLAAGTYFVDVSDNGSTQSGPYTLMYLPIVTAAATPIAAGAPLNATINPIGDLDLFTFTIAGTTNVTVRATGAAGVIDPCIRILTGAAGPPVNIAPSCSITARLDATLQAGTYFIEVSDNGNNQGGPYPLSLDSDTSSINTVSVEATDPVATEAGRTSAAVTFTRTGPTTAALRVSFTLSGTASLADFSSSLSATFIDIPAGQATATATGTANLDAEVEGDETIVVTLAAGSYQIDAVRNAATVTIVDNVEQTGEAVNGASHTGQLSTAGEIDVWTFTAAAGDRIGVHIGQIADDNDFRPWIRLRAPSGTILGSSAGAAAADLDGAVAPASGTYSIFVSSGDSGNDGTGTYRLTMTHTPGPIVISSGDHGGPLGNGGLHTGEILPGDLDVWTFTANAGDRIGVHIGEIVDTAGFSPWVRLWAPNGAALGSSSSTSAADLDGAVAPVSGLYLLLVASGDTGRSGSGTYRLTMTHTPGPAVVSSGDHGGPLTNGGMHTGEILRGDLDVWTFEATAGSRIVVHAGEIADAGGFSPWIRLWAPNGAALGSSASTGAAEINGPLAPVTGRYLVLVASGDAARSGAGTYRLTMTHTPGPVTVSTGDQGGPLTNGLTHLGEILQGDLDVWTFNASAGDRVSLHVGEIVDSNGFSPWMRLFAPNGAALASSFSTTTAIVEAEALTVTGTYLVLIASGDSGADGAGTYRLTMALSRGAITVSPGDQGGPLTNGAMHTGEIVNGDLDVWTFAATAGDRLSVHIGEVTDTGGEFTPWIRLFAPNGNYLRSAFGAMAAQIEADVAPVTGTYLVLVASGDSGVNGTGTYRLTLARSSGAVSVSPGDQGGPLTNGAMHTGEIVNGDLDVWTFAATAGDRLSVHIGEMTDAGGEFTPWIRLFAPNGDYLQSAFGAVAAGIEADVAPVTGTYLVLVASGDSGVNGAGTYRLTLGRSSGAVSVSSGDQGGPLTNGAMHTGEIVNGDLDVWTFAATAGDRISVHIGEVTDAGGEFTPWIRLFAPNGNYLASAFGAAAAQMESVVAPVTGTYLVLVASGDSGVNGTGTYRLTLARSSGAVSVSSGDQGGPLTNGFMHTGEIVNGDLDVWTFAATAGDRISAHIGEVTDTGGEFSPWIRLFAPNGNYLASAFGAAAAQMESVVAPVTGTYLVLVASGDSGVNGTGTYRLTMTHSPGPVGIAPGDQGGPLPRGVTQVGEIVRGDLDVWAIDLQQDERITVQVSETADGGDFSPWIRLFAPNGNYLSSQFGASAAQITAVRAPVAGRYLVLIASGDSGADGVGSYSMIATVTPP